MRLLTRLLAVLLGLALLVGGLAVAVEIGLSAWPIDRCCCPTGPG